MQRRKKEKKKKSDVMGFCGLCARLGLSLYMYVMLTVPPNVFFFSVITLSIHIIHNLLYSCCRYITYTN